MADIIGTITNLEVSGDKKNVTLYIEPDGGGEEVTYTIDRSAAHEFGLDSKVRVVQTIKKFRSASPTPVPIPVFGADKKPVMDSNTGSFFLSKKGKRPDEEKSRLEKALKHHGGKAAPQVQAALAKDWIKAQLLKQQQK